MLAHVALEMLGGVASRRQLIEAGCDGMWVDMGAQYRRILRVRPGWYVMPGTEPAVVRAVRVGGLLACVSALAMHEGRVPHDPIHVLVARGASRLRQADSPPVILHWTRHAVVGIGGIVPEAFARAQARGCRALEESDKACAVATAAGLA